MAEIEVNNVIILCMWPKHKFSRFLKPKFAAIFGKCLRIGAEYILEEVWKVIWELEKNDGYLINYIQHNRNGSEQVLQGLQNHFPFVPYWI